MKKYIIAIAVTCCAVSVLAQGKIDWGNNLGATVFRAPISGPQLADNTQSLTGPGTGSLYFPQGSTVYTGGFLSGSGYTMALLAGSSLTPVAYTTFRTGGSAGFINTATITLPTATEFEAGKKVNFQIAAWNNTAGTYDTWAKAETAWKAGTIAAGLSGIVQSGSLGGIDGGGNIVPNPGTTGWTPFNIYFQGAIVPEPSSIALLGLGALGMLLIRRK